MNHYCPHTRPRNRRSVSASFQFKQKVQTSESIFIFRIVLEINQEIETKQLK